MTSFSRFFPKPVLSPAGEGGQGGTDAAVAAAAAAATAAVVVPVVASTTQGETTIVQPAVAGNTTQLKPGETDPSVKPVDFLSTLSATNRAAMEKAGFKTSDSMVDSYNALRIEMQSKGFGELPADATAEQREAWNKARGRPDQATKYELQMPTDMPKDMPYNQDFATAFKTWAFDAGLTPTQANALHTQYVGMMAGAFKTSATDAVKGAQTAMDGLKQAWGEPTSPAYSKNVEMATRALRHLDPGLSDALKAKNLLGPDGTVLDASIAKALANAGQRLYAEDTLFGSVTSSISNPWEKGKENLTHQGEIFKANPERARTLAKAAGAKVNF